MKKTLIITLIATLSSLSNAALLLSVNGVVDPPDSEIILKPSETAILDVHGDGTDINPTGFIVVNGPGAINGGVIVYPGPLSFYEDIDPVDPIIQTLEPIFGNISDLSYWGLLDDKYPPEPTIGLLIDDILFHCEGLGDVYITLISEDLGFIYDQLVIHQIVPEPMSLAFLGLSVILMRRRK